MFSLHGKRSNQLGGQMAVTSIDRWRLFDVSFCLFDYLRTVNKKKNSSIRRSSITFDVDVVSVDCHLLSKSKQEKKTFRSFLTSTSSKRKRDRTVRLMNCHHLNVLRRKKNERAEDKQREKKEKAKANIEQKKTKGRLYDVIVSSSFERIVVLIFLVECTNQRGAINENQIGKLC